jgi:hypothetical protein
MDAATPEELASLTRWAEVMGTGNQIFPPARTALKLLASHAELGRQVNRSYCGYCGAELGPNDSPGAAGRAVEHFGACEKHPLGMALRENDRLKVELAAHLESTQQVLATARAAIESLEAERGRLAAEGEGKDKALAHLRETLESVYGDLDRLEADLAAAGRAAGAASDAQPG